MSGLYSVQVTPQDAHNDSRPACDHAVQFYEDDAFLFEDVGEFLAAGLKARQTLVVIATQAHHEGLRRDLIGRGIDVDAAIDDGRLIALDARRALDAFIVDGRPDRDRFFAYFTALLSGRDREHIRAYGEMVDVLYTDGLREAAIELEELWDELGRTRSLSLLCAYVMDNFCKTSDEDGLMRVCRAHTRVTPAESYPRGADSDERLREIARLQHRARALEHEVRRREELERHLREALERRRAAETDRAALLERERDSNRAKDEFLAMLGHELRNPLSPIVTALELMRERMGDIAKRERTIIERQVTHLRRIVDDLLDVSRITRGVIELDRHPIELSHAIRKALETASPVLEKRRHCVRTSIPASGLCVDADEDRIVQMMTHLLVNAARYTQPGGLVEVDARRDGDRVVVSVRDNGDGIAPDLLPNLFDVFVQGERPLARSQGGLGLGLPIVRSLVQMHGGTVEASSAGPGKGSEFTIVLPHCSTRRDVVARPDAGAVSESRRRRILVVDDNRDAAVLLTEALRAAGHEVYVAFDGPEALEQVGGLAPDAVLLDLGLPQMDGYEVAHNLRRRSELGKTKLVAMTGYGQRSDQQRTAEAGFAEHLVKPVTVAEVEAALDRLFSA